MVSAVASVFIQKSAIENTFDRRFFRSTAAALLLAFVLPVSETGEVPVARGLLAGGASPGPVVTYILAASSFNPLVITMTAIAFPDNLNLVWLRIAVTLITAVGAGALFRVLGGRFSLRGGPSYYSFSWASGELRNSKKAALMEKDEESPAGGLVRISDRLLVALEVARDEFFYLVRYLIAGAAAAAFIRLFISQNQILDLTGGTVITVFALMLLGIILCLNSNIDSSYIAAMPVTYPGGAVLGFLSAGSMMDLKSISMLFSVFKARAVVVLAVLVYGSTFVLCIISSYIFF